jgi:4-hydroxybenzoate polyprenyltransferase
MSAPTHASGIVAGLVRSMRPRQWIKNGVVFAPLIFARKIEVGDEALRAAAAFGLFCALASGVYLFNDLLDRESDRLHPEKRHRPIASGALPPRVAAATAAVLALGGLAASWALSPGFGAAATAYLLLQLCYSLWLKHAVLLDVFAIAGGFLLRVVAGALVVGVPISNWLYLCTLLLALFLALGKRRAELAGLQEDAKGHRRNLALYSVPMLEQFTTILAACTILAYALYTLSPDTVAKFGTDRLKYTVPCVIYGLFRYLFLVHRHGAGGSPEKVLLSDPPLLADVALFLALVIWVLYLS